MQIKYHLPTRLHMLQARIKIGRSKYDFIEPCSNINSLCGIGVKKFNNGSMRFIIIPLTSISFKYEEVFGGSPDKHTSKLTLGRCLRWTASVIISSVGLSSRTRYSR